MKKNLALRTAVDGILAALALTLSFLETLLPDVAFLPPGAKLGLSNVAVMFAVLSVGYADGICLALIKSGFVFLTRGPASFFMSLSGGVLSCLTLILLVILSEKTKKTFSYIGISVLCAVIHNAAQTAAACLYLHVNLIAYVPLLIVFGVAAGAVTGVILRAVMPVLLKIYPGKSG